MDFTPDKRKFKLVPRVVRCPVCAGKIEYLKPLALDKKRGLKSLLQDFCCTIKIFQAGDFLFAEGMSLQCSCGYSANEALTLKKDVIKLSLFEKTRKEKRLESVLKSDSLSSQSSAANLVHAFAQTERFEAEARSQELRESSGDSVSMGGSGSSDGGSPSKTTAKLVIDVAPSVQRRNLHLKVASDLYSRLQIALAIAKNNKSTDLFNALNGSKKVDATVSRLFNDYFMQSPEFLFDFSLVWERLRRNIFDNIKSFPDKYIFEEQVQQAKKSDEIDDRGLFYNLYLKVSHENSANFSCDLVFDNNSDAVVGVKSIIYENDQNSFMKGKEECLGKIEMLQGEIADLQEQASKDPTSRKMVENREVESSLEIKNTLTYEIRLLLNEIKRELLSSHFRANNLKIQLEKACVQIDESAFGVFKTGLAEFIEAQKTHLKNLIRQNNLPDAFTTLRSQLSLYKAWKIKQPEDEVLMVETFRRLFQNSDDENRSLASFNISENKCLSVAQILQRNRFEFSCDQYRGAFGDKLVYSLSNSISLIYSELYRFIQHISTDESDKHHILWKQFLNHELDFRKRMAQAFLDKAKKKNYTLDTPAIKNYMKMSKNYILPIKFSGSHRMISVFWLEDIIDTLYSFVEADFSPMLTKTFDEFDEIYSSLLRMELHPFRRKAEVEHYRELKTKFIVAGKKMETMSKISGWQQLIFIKFNFKNRVADYAKEVLAQEQKMLESLYFYNLKMDGRELTENSKFDPLFGKGQLLMERDLPFFLFLGNCHLINGDPDKARKNFYKLQEFKVSKNVSEASDIPKLYDVLKELTAEFSQRPCIYSQIPETEVLGEISSRVRAKYSHSYRYE